MQQNPRKYTGKDIDMLLAISVITLNAIDNKAFLISKRSTWAGTFFTDLQTDIDKVIKDYIGVDGAKALRKATAQVLAIQAEAMKLLPELKVQIETDFSEDKLRRTEILKTLGFTDYLKAARSGDQEALISLLYQFRKNMDDDLKTEITDKGTAAATIEQIIALAQPLKEKNITQEGFKGTGKEATAEAIAAFNGVYLRAIGIAKIAAKFYKTEPTKASLFSYAHIRKALNNKPGNNGSSTPTPPANQ